MKMFQLLFQFILTFQCDVNMSCDVDFQIIPVDFNIVLTLLLLKILQKYN